jgi:hypothetical protein
MSAPTTGTMMAVSLAATVASTAMSVAGQMQQQQAAQAQHAYQAQVMRNNQMTADMMAADALERGKIAEQKQREKTRQILGTQTARLAAQGGDMLGSEQDILGDTEEAGEQDALTIRSNAAREAWAHREKSAQFAAESQRPLLGASGLGIGASLIGGIGSVADKWYKFNPSTPSSAAGGYGSSFYTQAASAAGGAMMSGGHM